MTETLLHVVRPNKLSHILYHLNLLTDHRLYHRLEMAVGYCHRSLGRMIWDSSDSEATCCRGVVLDKLERI